MSQNWRSEHFNLGACYYPEHWPEQLWETDFKRMREHGFRIIRVAEFAWSIFEPEEGRFEFDLFDRAIDLAHQHGLKVIVGTPTATPPAWLTSKYPEVLNVALDGTVYHHGQRRHYNYNSEIYHKLTARIVTTMAEHYKNHPGVVGWQIDNELNCETNVFYSEADHVAFRKWLQSKYKTLDQLNRAWGAVFWNQTYSDWEQVHLSRPTPSSSPNPHLALDEKRFFSDSAISFAKLQADILRKIAPNQWVTTNGIFGHLDNHQLNEELLDFFSYDSYPNFSTIYPDKGEKPLLDRKWSLNLSEARSVSSNFCVMEQQSGPGGWVNQMEMPSPKPGQMRLWTYQTIAHGADMLLYFRWRTSTVGTEIYWHGIYDYDNRPNRRAKEAEQIGKELNVVGQDLLGSKYEASVAIMKNYDNDWDGELDRWHGPLSGKSVSAWFRALQRSHIPADIQYLRDSTELEDLIRYKVIIFPHPAIMSERNAQLLKRYVEQGGTIIFGCRSGYKNEFGHCYMMPKPGPLAELCGIDVEDFTLIGPHQKAPALELHGMNTDQILFADSFVDILRVTEKTATIKATYADDYYAGKPALVKNTKGKGQVYYYGSAFTEAMAKLIIDELGIKSPVCDVMELSEDVELAIRTHAETGKKYVFLLNFAHTVQKVNFHKPFRDLLNNKDLKGEQTLEPFEVCLIEI